ncbi:MAG: hypothetical protein IJU41_10255 [Clostridia bacterium]|nr:hypothetical protein [Clostridia bacterium]
MLTMKHPDQKRTVLIFALSLAAILLLFAVGVVKTDDYNRKVHLASFAGEDLFVPEPSD